MLFLIGIAISPWGKIKLGVPKSKPTYSRLAWISMLYSAGMGAGILLRAVQEPVFMYQNPPLKTASSAEKIALEFTFYQWGFTAWAFYALFALLIGYAVFKHKLPVSISSIFKSREEQKHTFFHKFIDVLTLLTTVFGLVAAVGLGAAQINGGLNHILETSLDYLTIILLVIGIGTLALISALSGVDKGIKRISTLNIYLTLALLVFVFVQSDMVNILIAFAEATYQYIIDFVPMSLAVGAFDPGEKFLTDWTYYYWAFWLAWAPFTGIFIARISQGRTLREIIIGTLLIPSLGTFFWFSVFGDSAFTMIESWGEYNGEFGDVFSSIFVFLSGYPFASLINGIVILLLVSFLVTSVDSAIYVMGMLSDRGNPHPSKRIRVLWGVLLTVFCVGIVLLGHARPESDILTAVQKLLIVTSLPFAFLMIALVIAWLRKLKKP